MRITFILIFVASSFSATIYKKGVCVDILQDFAFANGISLITPLMRDTCQLTATGEPLEIIRSWAYANDYQLRKSGNFWTLKEIKIEN